MRHDFEALDCLVSEHFVKLIDLLFMVPGELAILKGGLEGFAQSVYNVLCQFSVVICKGSSTSSSLSCLLDQLSVAFSSNAEGMHSGLVLCFNVTYYFGSLGLTDLTVSK